MRQTKGANIVIVIPCYNEEDGLRHLIKSLLKIRAKLTPDKFDVIFVNDGSSDATQHVIDEIAQEYDFVFFRMFSKNAGHQSALRAGIDACESYDAVIMMDADMQHPPELIPDMIQSWREGASIVQMVRKDSAREAGLIKYTTSKMYYRLINWLSSLHMEYGASDFRLIDKSVTRTVISSSERDLFLRGYFSWLPATRIVIEYKPAKRFAGKSKYTLRKMLDLASKGVLQFSEKPLKIATNIGMFMAVVSIIYGAFLVIRYLAGDYTVSGWTSLMVILLFCFGLNFILLGIIGHYLAHALALQKRRPDYIVASEKLRKF